MASRKKMKLSKICEVDAPHDATVSKTRKSTRRSRKGCLETVQALPLDVSLQIFGLLHPKDLLNLARTSKAFRSFFLNRANSISIWKASLRLVDGLPDKPEFLSEPTFAHLLFNPFCQKCGKSGIHNPIWPWFVRYCTTCIVKSSVRVRNYTQYSDRPLECVIKEHGTKIFNVHRIPCRREGSRIHKPQFDRFMEQWENTQGDEEQRKVLVEQTRIAAGERAAFVFVPMGGFPKWTTSEKSTSSALIVGWPKVRTAIQDEMSTIRACRLEEERETQIKARWNELAEAILDHYVQLPKTASMDCRPTPHILLTDEECFKLVVAARDREVTRRDFAAVLPEVCARWQASCADELRGLVRGVILTVAEYVDPLDLAVAVFNCENSMCSEKVAHRYPDLLAHTCACRYGPRFAEQEEKVRVRRAVVWLSKASEAHGATAYASVNGLPGTKIRLHGGLRRPDDSVIRMQYIVAALGLDPARATRDDLERCEARLWCRVCSSTTITRKVHTWEAALWHSHAGAAVDRDFWERVPEEDMAVVRALEATLSEGVWSREKVRWGCTLCRDWDGTSSQMEIHLKEKHQLGDFGACVQDGTVYQHLSQPCSSTPSTVNLPKPPAGSESPTIIALAPSSV
ncbi:hypothetical protein V8D89_011841 [Ganoderma adspersum]